MSESQTKTVHELLSTLMRTVDFGLWRDHNSLSPKIVKIISADKSWSYLDKLFGLVSFKRNNVTINQNIQITLFDIYRDAMGFLRNSRVMQDNWIAMRKVSNLLSIESLREKLPPLICDYVVLNRFEGIRSFMTDSAKHICDLMLKVSETEFYRAPLNQSICNERRKNVIKIVQYLYILIIGLNRINKALASMTPQKQCCSGIGLQSAREKKDDTEEVMKIMGSSWHRLNASFGPVDEKTFQDSLKIVFNALKNNDLEVLENSLFPMILISDRCGKDGLTSYQHGKKVWSMCQLIQDFKRYQKEEKLKEIKTKFNELIHEFNDIEHAPLTVHFHNEDPVGPGQD